MRRYGLVDIPDQASDIDAVPITRTITINGTTFDLSADRTYTVGGMAIGGTITSATPGSVLFAGTSGVLAQDNANFFWDDTNNRLGIGTTTPSNKLSIVETTNVASGFNVTNTTAGTSNSLNMNLVADTTAGYLQFQKRSSTHTATGIANASSGLLYNSAGDLIIGTGGATSWIRFATNGIATANMNLTANGRLLLGTSTESSYILDVQGENSRFGGTTNYTVLYSQANGGGIGLFKSDILLSNLIQNELNISAGIATGDVISIYCSDTLVPGTVRPLCINGNGRETVFGSDTTSNTASSLVTMVSTTKGFLPPRMTSTQRTAISSPATGLIVYQTDSTVGLYLRNSSAWVLLGSGAGTVTDVSVVSANGLAGTVATSTTTPAITLSTTVTGLLKGNGTAISAATAGTDYQAPITLTTTGTSGAATLISNTLNIPNYSSGTVTSGTYTPTSSGAVNCTVGTVYKNQYLRIDDVVTVSGYVDVKPSNTTAVYYFTLNIPINNGIGAGTWASGNCTAYPDASINLNVGIIEASTTTNRITLIMNIANHTAYVEHYYHFTYRLIA